MRTMGRKKSDLDMTHNDNLRMNPYTVDFEPLKKSADDEYTQLSRPQTS